jgi:transcription elongation factor Elf1
MKGDFICPYCKTRNDCDCKSCREYIQEGEFINKWTEDGELLICGNCGQIYSPDQALDEEYKTFNTNEK